MYHLLLLVVVLHLPPLMVVVVRIMEEIVMITRNLRLVCWSCGCYSESTDTLHAFVHVGVCYIATI